MSKELKKLAGQFLSIILACTIPDDERCKGLQLGVKSSVIQIEMTTKFKWTNGSPYYIIISCSNKSHQLKKKISICLSSLRPPPKKKANKKKHFKINQKIECLGNEMSENDLQLFHTVSYKSKSKLDIVT